MKKNTTHNKTLDEWYQICDWYNCVFRLHYFEKLKYLTVLIDDKFRNSNLQIRSFFTVFKYYQISKT